MLGTNQRDWICVSPVDSELRKTNDFDKYANGSLDRDTHSLPGTFLHSAYCCCPCMVPGHQNVQTITT